MKYISFFIAGYILLSCNNSAENNTATKDSNAPATAAATAENMNPAIDSIHAQDTLFEDGSVPVPWKNAGFSDPVAFKTFILQLKDWVRNDNIDSIATHTQFPLKNVKTKDAFKKEYTNLFNEKVKTAVAAQRVDRIFRNSSGAMIGSGKLWLTENSGKYFIIAVNNK